MFLFNKIVNEILLERKISEADRILRYNDLKRIVEIEIEKTKKQNFISPEVYDILRHIASDISILKKKNRSTDIIPQLEVIYSEIKNIINIQSRIIRLKNILNDLKTEKYKKAILSFNNLKQELIDGVKDKELNRLTKLINDKILEKTKEKQQQLQQKEELKQNNLKQREEMMRQREERRIQRQPKSSQAEIIQRALDKTINSSPKRSARQEIIQRALDRINNK